MKWQNIVIYEWMKRALNFEKGHCIASKIQKNSWVSLTKCVLTFSDKTFLSWFFERGMLPTVRRIKCLDNSFISLAGFPSTTNLKPHSVHVTSKLIKKIITNLGLSKASGLDYFFQCQFWRTVSLTFHTY